MKFLRYILIPAVAMSLVSCDNELSGTDWQPGEVSNAPGVYFSADNEHFVTLLGLNSTASLTVKRLDTKGELVVPVEVSEAPEGMIVPASVTFPDGVAETVLDIDCSGMAESITCPFSISFPEQYRNPYAAGTATFDGSIIRSSWVNVNADGSLTEFVVMNWSQKDAGFEHIYCELQRLPGSNRYRIPAFLGTNINFQFELVKSELQPSRYRIKPLANQLLLSDYGFGDYSYYNSWWLVTDNYENEDDENEGWADLLLTYPDGRELTIYYLQFLWYDEATKSEYCYVSSYEAGKPVAYMAFTGNLDEDMQTYASYYFLRFAWTEEPNAE